MKIAGIFSEWEDNDGCCVVYPLTVTTEHAASSCGQPVVVIDDTPHGPGDLYGLGEVLVPAEHIERIRAVGFSVQALDEPLEVVDEHVTHWHPAAKRIRW